MVRGKEEKNNSIVFKNLWIKTNDGINYDFKDLCNTYTNLLSDYIDELSIRGALDCSIYEELVGNAISIYKNGYSLDEDPDRFSLVNGHFKILSYKDSKGNIYSKEFIRALYSCIFGYGIPEFYVNFEARNFISKSQLDKLNNAVLNIESKLIYILRKLGFNDNLIKEELEFNKELYTKSLSIQENILYSEEMKKFYDDVNSNEMLRVQRLVKKNQS